MPFCEPTDSLRRELQEIACLAEKLSEALALAASGDFSLRQMGLAELRTLRIGLLGVLRHCSSGEVCGPLPCPTRLAGENYDQLDQQHLAIRRLVQTFLRDLPYATADSIADSVPGGEELVEKLEEHISLEGELLTYTEELCAVTT